MRLPAVVIAAVVLLLTCSPSRAELFHLWSYSYGDSLYDSVQGVAFDTDGSVVVAGHFLKAIDFGGGPLVSAGGSDVFIARFDADMQHVWSRRFGDAQFQWCNAMALAPNGDLVIVGVFGGAIDFGGGPLVSAGVDDIFVASFDRTGALAWAKGFPRAQSQSAADVAVDADGNVFMTGSFFGGIDFGGGLLTSFGGPDAFLVKFSAAGGHVWSKRFGDRSGQFGQGVSTDGAGNVVAVGEFDGTIDLGGGGLTSAGNRDIFLARWDAAGTALWSRRFGDPQFQRSGAVACAPDGTIAISGGSSGTIDLGDGVLLDKGNFLAVLKEDGTHRWSVVPPVTGGVVWFSGITFREQGMLAAGYVHGSVILAGMEFLSAGNTDMLVLNFDGAGNLVEGLVQGAAPSEWVNALATKPNGEIVVAGEFDGASNLGGDALAHSGDGGQDIFIAAYGPIDPDYTPIAGFSAVVRGAIVEVRWQLATDDPADTYRLLRRVEPDGSWTVLAQGPIDPGARAYDDASVTGERTYAYQLGVMSGEVEYLSRIVTVQVPQLGLSLLQNAPNPFNGTTTIGYAIPHDSPVTIHIYDTAGRRIARLDEGFRSAGAHEATWDGRDASGRPVASGVYFYRLEGTADAGARKMLLVR